MIADKRIQTGSFILIFEISFSCFLGKSGAVKRLKIIAEILKYESLEKSVRQRKAIFFVK